MKPTLIFILGPTSSGKSGVAAGLAEKLGGEVISCDSMQVYKDMDIVTQAPGKDLEAKVPHHLLGIIRPEEEFSAARFAELASDKIKDVISRGKLPVLAGGTGLYVKALLDGLFPSPPKDEDLRKRFEELAAKKGASYLYDKLRKADPEAARKIDANNVRRVVRALEVLEITGVRFSEKKAETKGIADKYGSKLFGLEVPRDVLSKRIDARVDKMFRDGLVDEVKALSGRNLSVTADKALGIKEVKAYLNGDLTLEETREELKKNTRQYAKRQRTWFNADKRIEWINADRDISGIVGEIERKVKD